MCSICGIADFKNHENASPAIAARMSAAMAHRGPDQSGNFKSGGIAFSHNRLAVIDIENGLQPMSARFENKNYTIVYNGELYNMPELAAELKAYGVEFKTRCDTEVVLYSYIIFKEKCAEKLNGIFAFAVYDEAENSLYLARDRFGVKPLFYTQKGDTLIFASEIKALLKHPDIIPAVDRYGLWQLLFLAPGTLSGTTVYKDIRELRPGKYACFKDGVLSTQGYWGLKAGTYKKSSAEAAADTKELLIDAIERQLVSDAPLCTLLSGGMDSSIITSIASSYYKNKGEILDTYSFEYEGNKENFKSSLFQPQSDDYFADLVSQRLGTNRIVLSAPTEKTAALLTDAAAARDMPGQADIDSSLLYYCSLIKERHTVAISGECADEIFGGYPWFYRTDMVDGEFFPWIHAPLKRAGLFRAEKILPGDGYVWLREEYSKSLASCPIHEDDTPEMITSRRATWLSVNFFMSSLLERKDRMSMHSGVEVRVPFADHRILEYVFDVPWNIKFENGVEKALLRNAAKGLLPKEILQRKKSPYPKTHNPQYEKIVTEMLMKKLALDSSPLAELIDKRALTAFLEEADATWFGQLMGKAQLIAWLIQLDYWLSSYNIKLEL